MTRAPVAIVGIGCRFPGGVADAASFWRAVSDGVNAVGPIPASRMGVDQFFDPRAATPGRMMTRWGGFLDQIDQFDAAFFGISPMEAERLDPQQRLLLETGWEALEDAGENVARLEGSRTGVFVGQWLSDFEARVFADPEQVDFFMTTGSGRYAASGRLSYVLGAQGPSLTVDTACSSSLVAIHLAARSIQNGESDLALAGGVNVILMPHISIAYSQSRMMAPDGKCKFGDASGDGYVRSEGAAVVVLKPLERALDDGDRVYAVIRGSAINNDGRSSGSLGTPSQVGQEELLRSAYRDADVDPARVRYVEAHGTGTKAGDPVELGALHAVLSPGRAPQQRAYVGSVKTNFGHTEGAAGVAGLIKTALALHHRAIPASLHFSDPNPEIPWREMPLDIPREQSAWPAGDGARVAGVSAFGIAGTNAHIVLEEAPSGARASAKGPMAGAASHVLPLSARSAPALHALALRYADVLERDATPALGDVCRNAATRRTPLEHRAVFVAPDRAGIVRGLRGYASGEPAAADGVFYGASRPKIAFVCPGQGAQWIGMARELMASQPAFLAALQRCDRAARPYTDWSILVQLALDPSDAAYRLDQIDVIQPVLVALAIAYADLWRSFGVDPDAIVGHSMGEVAAAHIVGVLDLDQAMRIICRRSALMRRASGRGAMALIELPFADVQSRIAGREDTLAVAVSNSPRSSVLSGDPAAVNAVIAELEREQIFCRLIKVDVASHSPQMDPLAAELGSELSDLAPTASSVPLYSTVLARPAEGPEFGAAYWAANLRKPVMFGDTVSRLIGDGVSVFIELGPHPVLLPSIEQTAQHTGASVVAIGCARREEPESAALLTAVGALYCAGYPVAWSRVLPEAGAFCDLPHYPWQRERHWVDVAELGHASPASRSLRAGPDAESLGWLYTMKWELTNRDVSVSSSAGKGQQWLVVSAERRDGEAVRGALESQGATATGITLRDLGVALASHRDVTGIVLLADADRDAAYQPLTILQSVLACDGARPRLWFVTRGAQPVSAERTERVSADQAALWGAARVIAEEHPDLWGGLVDLDATTAIAQNVERLVRELVQGDGEDQVAFRGGNRFALRLHPLNAEPTAAAAPPWRADAAYLITGGLGDIGLHVARAMASQGVRRLILLGRTSLPQRSQWNETAPDTTTGRRVSAIRALEASGVAVHVAAVDVGDEIQLKRFLDEYAAEAWPPIRGVVHAAGLLENQLAGAMSRETFDGGVHAKLRGAQALDRLLPDLDVFVLFSSTGAFLAQPGQANYAAANAGLDALAHDRRARGLPALSVGWGIWESTGLVKTDAARTNVQELARQGVGTFSAARGLALFDVLRGRREPSIAVLPIDWSAFKRARGSRNYPLFRRQLAQDIGDSDTSASTVAVRLETAHPRERQRLIDGAVRESLGRVLKLAPARLEARQPFGALGLTSLMALEFRNRLESHLGRSLPATLAWNYPTVESLVAFLCGSPVDAAPARRTSEPIVDAAIMASIADVAGLSDDDAARQLRKRGRA